MDAVLRLIMRVILIPIAYVAAIVAGTAVIAIAAWRSGDIASAAATFDPPEFGIIGLFFASTVLFTVLLTIMWLPASVGILLSEGFAIRSWMFHAANGAASAWLGWKLFPGVDDMRTEMHLSNGEPMVIVAAGLAGGLAYWLVAGWSAGFWKPVYGAAASRPGTGPQSAATLR